MLHLVRASINPVLGLRACVANWPQISMQLREPPRRRMGQPERLRQNGLLLS